MVLTQIPRLEARIARKSHHRSSDMSMAHPHEWIQSKLLDKEKEADMGPALVGC